MRLGIACLVLAYGLSQFYRAFLAVLAPDLAADVGADPAALARASGLWFLTFAAMQLPVGWALDRIGPRLTAAVLLAAGGGGGAAVFAMASTPLHIEVAMALIGVGCSPVLMASYYIFARAFRPALFATLGAATIGLGSLGNVAGAAPLAWAAASFGWRGTVAGIAALTLAVAALIVVTVRDPERADQAGTGSIFALLKRPEIWPILAVMFVSYAPSAGIRGLWIGPYFADVHAAGPALIGQATLAMALAMIAGNFAYGPLDRLFGTRKWVILCGNLAGAAALLGLWAGFSSPWAAIALFAAVGFFGATFAVIMAHGRALFPPHLAGRGVTLMNLFAIGGVGLFQFGTGRVHAAAATPDAAYGGIFLVFAVALLLGSAVYLMSQDRTD